jgi:hypothetical protein
MEGLRECPHCGFEAVDFESPTNGLGWHAGCKACSSSVLGLTRENAVHKWNTRTDPLMEEMARALGDMVTGVVLDYHLEAMLARIEAAELVLQKYRERKDG